MAIDQRNAGASISSGGGTVYCVDRWYFGSNGANTTAQRVAGSGSTQYRLQITGAASVTSVSCGQRIEAANSYDFAGSTVTLSFDMANSLLTSVTWALSYANSTDSFGTFGSPTVTSISSGSVTINSTVTRYSVQIAIPAAATTGLQLQFSVGAQTSGTWTIGNVQLETGNVATPYERQIYSDQLAQCQRFFLTSQIASYQYVSSASTVYAPACWPTMRTTPTTAIITSNLYSNTTSVSIVASSASGGYISSTITAGGWGGGNPLFSLSSEL